MRVIQSLGWYFPDSWGGTEAYVAALAGELAKSGVQSVVAAPAAHARDVWHEGHPVHRYAVQPQRRHGEISGALPHGGFAEFQRWLAGQDVQLYHQHSWTYGCGLHHLLAARQSGLATVLTVHVPGPVCPRGTMVHLGARACAGMLDDGRCADCWLQSRGAPAALRPLLATIPAPAGAALRRLGRAGTALAARSLVRQHRAQLLRAAQACDRVVAVCQWLFDALILAGVPRHKVLLCRQGVSGPFPAAPMPRPPAAGPLVVGYLGRWDLSKGPDLLAEAMLRLPADAPVELRLHGMDAGTAENAACLRAVQEAAARRPLSIRVGPALPPGEVPAFLQSVDVLAVPSQWMETGPLVVLEAFAAGTPVLGSDLGGIAELVKHGRDGWLVRHDSPEAWAAALSELAANPARVQQLRGGIAPVRTMAQVARETLELYQGVLAGQRERSA